MTLSTAIAQTINTSRRNSAAPATRLDSAARPARRERDFGIGYGNSSGYASDKRYTRDWGNARFRFA